MIPWSLMRLSTVWYDVGCEILNLNMPLCFKVLVFFWAIYFLRSCFSFIAAKNRTVTMFFLVLTILVSSPRHKQPLTSHIEPTIKSCPFVAKYQIFLNCSSNNSLKKLNIIVLLCLNVQTRTVKNQF